MAEDKLIVASSANERFAMGLTVLLCSIVLSNRVSDILFYVVDDGILADTKKLIIQKVTDLSLARGIKVELRFLVLSEIQMPDLPTMKGSHTSYARLFFPEVLSEASIYYVDSDIICNRPFIPLAEMESLHAQSLIAGCRDDGPCVPFDQVWAEKCGKGLYVNAGFLWMNLRLMREDRFVGRVFEDAEVIDGIRNKITPFHDQTLINCHCHGRVGEISGHFNVIGSTLFSQGMNLEDNWHFTGEFKPWLNDGELGHLTEQFHVYYTLVAKLGLAHRLPYVKPYLPLSKTEYVFRHFIAGRLWLRGGKRHDRFIQKVRIYQKCKRLSAAYALKIDGMMAC